MNSETKEMFPFIVIRKRDGRLTRFDIKKIVNAIDKAFFTAGVKNIELCEELANQVVEELVKSISGNVPQVEEIQDVVERVLVKKGYAKEAKAFILYRAKRTSIREGKTELMDTVETILQETDKPTPFSQSSPGAKMMRIASAASRNYYLTRIIPSQFAEAHIKGDIHIHDLDFYGKTIKSLQLPLGEILHKGFYSGYNYIKPPENFPKTLMQTDIIIRACQNDLFGGQSIPAFDQYLSSYIRDHLNGDVSREEILNAMEGLISSLNMNYTRVGAQVYDCSINIGLDTSNEGRIIISSLLDVLERGLGRSETPLYPWIIFQVKDGVNFKESEPNYDLYKRAIKVSSRRMNPIFAFLDSPVNQNDEEIAYWGDGTRVSKGIMDTFHNIQNIRDAESYSHWGWGTIAQVTVSLPKAALKISHKRRDFSLESFKNELRRTLELCAKQLVHRKDKLADLKIKDLPFVMGEGIYRGSKGLSSTDAIDEVLKNGSLMIGFVGLAEALTILKGQDHSQDEETLNFGLEIVDFMKVKIEELSKEHEANFVLSASSSGYAAQRFPQLDRLEFGNIPQVNDKTYYTQNFALPAECDIPWEKKLEIEGKFHKKIPGGHFTYLNSSNVLSVEKYEEVLAKMKQYGIALGGVSFPLRESLDDGSLISQQVTSGGHIRQIYRAAGILMPEEWINEALKDELEDRVYDLG